MSVFSCRYDVIITEAKQWRRGINTFAAGWLIYEIVTSRLHREWQIHPSLKVDGTDRMKSEIGASIGRQLNSAE